MMWVEELAKPLKNQPKMFFVFLNAITVDKYVVQVDVYEHTDKIPENQIHRSLER